MVFPGKPRTVAMDSFGRADADSSNETTHSTIANKRNVLRDDFLITKSRVDKKNAAIQLIRRARISEWLRPNCDRSSARVSADRALVDDADIAGTAETSQCITDLSALASDD